MNICQNWNNWFEYLIKSNTIDKDKLEKQLYEDLILRNQYVKR
jgi:hypothetical protein